MKVVRRLRTLIRVMTLMAAARTLAAQADPLAPVCAAGATPVVDSSVVVVGLSPSAEFRGRRYDAAHRLQNLYIADAIRAHFVVPQSLGTLLVLGESPLPNAPVGQVSRAVLNAEFVVIRSSDGHLRQIAWLLQPVAAPLGEALVAAVRGAEADGSLAEIHRPAGAKGDDTVAISVVTTTDSAPPRVPLMRARVAVYVVDSAAMVVKLESPIYPEAARQARATGELDAWFMLGSDARMIPASLQFARADWQVFMEPIRTALLASRFMAAQSGGCRVPLFAHQTFSFRLFRR